MQVTRRNEPGCPIRKSQDQSSVTSSPGHIAGSNVLHRLSTPRHPPCALIHLITPTRFRQQRRHTSLHHHHRPGMFNTSLRTHDLDFSIVLTNIKTLRPHSMIPDPGEGGRPSAAADIYVHDLSKSAAASAPAARYQPQEMTLAAPRRDCVSLRWAE